VSYFTNAIKVPIRRTSRLLSSKPKCYYNGSREEAMQSPWSIDHLLITGVDLKIASPKLHTLSACDVAET